MSAPEGPAGIAADQVAFEVFYRRHVGAVTRFFARRVADPHLVADLTADTFVAVIGSAARYHPELGSELGWLYGIARNVLAGQWRRTARELRATRQVAGRRLLDDDDIARLEARMTPKAKPALQQLRRRLPQHRQDAARIRAERHVRTLTAPANGRCRGPWGGRDSGIALTSLLTSLAGQREAMG